MFISLYLSLCSLLARFFLSLFLAAISELDTLSEDSYKDSTIIMQKIVDLQKKIARKEVSYGVRYEEEREKEREERRWERKKESEDKSVVVVVAKVERREEEELGGGGREEDAVVAVFAVMKTIREEKLALSIVIVICYFFLTSISQEPFSVFFFPRRTSVQSLSSKKREIYSFSQSFRSSF